MKTQFVTDEKGKKVSVILSLKDYKRLLEELDELEDVRLYDSVKSKNEERILLDDYLKQRKTKSKNA